MKNPIIDNRIVSDTTFAIRLLSHLRECTANCCMGQEEIDYLTIVARGLQQYQIETVYTPTEEEIKNNLPEAHEYKYLQRLNLIKNEIN